MSNRFELDTAGVRELLQSEEMKNALHEVASEVQARCGEGYEIDIAVMPTRAIAAVYAADDNAVRDNSSNNTLLKALG